jgi:hypothetical protein
MKVFFYRCTVYSLRQSQSVTMFQVHCLVNQTLFIRRVRTVVQQVCDTGTAASVYGLRIDIIYMQFGVATMMSILLYLENLVTK